MSELEKNVYDFGIVGCGPVGIYAGFYAGFRGLTSIAFDTLPELGGQLINLYPEKWIFDVGGHVKIAARDYIDSILQQASQYVPEYHLSERVERIEVIPGMIQPGYRIVTPKRKAIVRCVLIAGGMGAYIPRKLELPNLEQLEERGIHYRVLAKEQFRGKRVMIVGGGDSAIDWTINLDGIAAKTWAVHRSRHFKALEANVEEMIRNTGAEILTPWEVKALHGEERLEAATLLHSESGEERYFEVDDLLLMIGLMANLGPIEGWGVQIKGNGVIADRHLQTNLPGIYAIGDIAKYNGKVNLIAAGNGEAATAIEHALASHLRRDPKPRDWE